jgi:putative CocE/NonD family hydrolase
MGYEVERDVRIVTADGVELSTDIYHPDVAGPVPTLMQRTCYDKDVMAPWIGITDAVEHGYRVVFQDCRGSGKSTGDAGFFEEAADGRTTGDWIAEQPWFDGRLGTFGGSYMTFTQWAFASTKPPYLKAMSISLGAADRTTAWFPGNSFAFDMCLSWSRSRLLGVGESFAKPEETAQALQSGFDHLPLGEADVVGAGLKIPWWQDWMDHPHGDPYWSELDFRDTLDWLSIPVMFLDGWYDYPLPHLLRDHATFDRTGSPHKLVVGPWVHAGGDPDVSRTAELAWFDRWLKGDESVDTGAAVSIFVMPDVGWRDLPSWPPPSQQQRLYLQPSGALSSAPAPEGAGATLFTYDPANPTPSLGGTALRPEIAGPMDNAPLEARDDVLTFTTDVLEGDLEVVGTVTAELYLSSSVEHLDVFVRLCDVNDVGVSTNVCDALRRLQPGDLVEPVIVELWPTAYRFAAGHRVRVQVSGGAHPLYARNTCSGEPMGTATTLIPAHNVIHHDADRPSAVVLSVTS